MKTANRIIALFLSVVIISTLLIPSVFAADPNVEFSSTKTSVNSGDTFVVSIKATDELTNVYSVGPLIRFDKTKLEVTDLKWNSSIPYAYPSTVETANTNGFFTTNYADNTTGAALDISSGDVFVEATFAVKSGASGSTEITTEAEFADEYGVEVAGAVLNQDKITITIVSGITGSLPISITAPAKGATPQSTISDTAQYTGTIVWEGSPATFAPSTVYTAKVELTAKSGYQFAASVNPTVVGADSITGKTVSSDGNKLTFKVTFPATADKDTPTITTLPTASAITYGQTLADSTFSGGEAKFNSSTVAGTFAWKTPSTAPTVADSGATEYVVTFTPNDTSSYASTTCKVKLIVNPKDVTATQSIQNQNVVLYRGDFTQPELEDPSITVNEPTYSYGGAADYEAIKSKLAALSVGQTGDIAYTFTANGNYIGTITGNIHFTIVDLPAATVAVAPIAKTDLVYNGGAQELVTAGEGSGGTMQYSLDSSIWSENIPKGTDAKNYTVYYKVKGDAGHSDSAVANFTVSIDKKPATVAPKSFTITKGDAIPTFELTYTGLVSGDTLTPSATPTFTCVESDGSTPVNTSTPAGTYIITWTNESSTTFTGANNYNLTATETATLTIKNKKPSGGSGSSSGGSFGGGYRLPMKPADDTFSQPAGCVSDTIGDVNVSGAYQFRLTSTNGSTPVVTLSDTAFHGVFASQEGNDYFYKVYADGQPGQTCIVTVNGTTVARLTIVSASGSGVISDTTAPFTVPQGGAYQFRLTADTKPTMTAGSPSFTVAYVGNEGKDWFFKVYAVGNPGDGCGFYINGAPVPVAVAHIS